MTDLYNWYFICENGTYYDGYSADFFFSQSAIEYDPVEFGIINDQREKILRFNMEQQTLVMANFTFNLQVVDYTKLIFQMKRHVQVGPTGTTEMPRLYQIGFDGFLVSLHEETGEIGFVINNKNQDKNETGR